MKLMNNDKLKSLSASLSGLIGSGQGVLVTPSEEELQEHLEAGGDQGIVVVLDSHSERLEDCLALMVEQTVGTIERVIVLPRENNFASPHDQLLDRIEEGGENGLTNLSERYPVIDTMMFYDPDSLSHPHSGGQKLKSKIPLTGRKRNGPWLGRG